MKNPGSPMLHVFPNAAKELIYTLPTIINISRNEHHCMMKSLMKDYSGSIIYRRALYFKIFVFKNRRNFVFCQPTLFSLLSKPFQMSDSSFFTLFVSPTSFFTRCSFQRIKPVRFFAGFTRISELE